MSSSRQLEKRNQLSVCKGSPDNIIDYCSIPIKTLRCETLVCQHVTGCFRLLYLYCSGVLLQLIWNQLDALSPGDSGLLLYSNPSDSILNLYAGALKLKSWLQHIRSESRSLRYVVFLVYWHVYNYNPVPVLITPFTLDHWSCILLS